MAPGNAVLAPGVYGVLIVFAYAVFGLNACLTADSLSAAQGGNILM